jgi:hypothetical protein
LCDEGGEDAGLDAGPGDCLHYLEALLFVDFLACLVAEWRGIYFQKKKDMEEAWVRREM